MKSTSRRNEAIWAGRNAFQYARLVFMAGLTCSQRRVKKLIRFDSLRGNGSERPVREKRPGVRGLRGLRKTWSRYYLLLIR